MSYKTDEHGDVVHCDQCHRNPATIEVSVSGGALLLCPECANERGRKRLTPGEHRHEMHDARPMTLTWISEKRELRPDNYELIEVKGGADAASLPGTARRVVLNTIPGVTVTDVWIYGRVSNGNHVYCVEYDLPDEEDQLRSQP